MSANCRQLGLLFEPPCVALVLQYGRIDCAYGESGIGWNGLLQAHCHRCLMAIGESIAAFWAEVAAGTFDEAGYTKADRKAQQRKLAA